MKIVDLIGRDMIVPALAGTDKRSILEELAAHVARQHPRLDRATLTRLPVGKLRDDADVNAMFGAAYEEVAAVGRALGVTLPADIVERTFNFNRNAPPHLMASMAVDLLRGNRIELPWLSGIEWSAGEKHGSSGVIGGTGPAFTRFGSPDAINLGGPDAETFVIGNQAIGMAVGGFAVGGQWGGAAVGREAGGLGPRYRRHPAPSRQCLCSDDQWRHLAPGDHA